MNDAPDLTLEETRALLAPTIARNAAFDGWGSAALALAANEHGVPAGKAELAFEQGPAAMIDAWFAHIDAVMTERLPPQTLSAMRIRERITALVTARLEIAAPDREALRRALAILALPVNVRAGARLGWRAADTMWRAAGDQATDFSHYTKRMTLGGVYFATLMVFIDDDSERFVDTRAFLARRIDGVMRFEKLKAQLKPNPDAHFSPARFLGRLRYPVT